MFLKIGVLKNFAMFTGKHLPWRFFSIGLLACRTATLSKRGSNTGAFLWIAKVAKLKLRSKLTENIATKN